jgi:hypothetical protein
MMNRYKTRIEYEPVGDTRDLNLNGVCVGKYAYAYGSYITEYSE